LTVPHLEDIAEDKAKHASTFEGVTNGPFRHDDIVLFDKSRDRDVWRSSGAPAFNLIVEGLATGEVKGTRDYPFDVIGKAGQHLLMVPAAVGLHVSLHSLFVQTHLELERGAKTFNARLRWSRRT
jgi:hypothetical protein